MSGATTNTETIALCTVRIEDGEMFAKLQLGESTTREQQIKASIAIERAGKTLLRQMADDAGISPYQLKVFKRRLLRVASKTVHYREGGGS